MKVRTRLALANFCREQGLHFLTDKKAVEVFYEGVEDSSRSEIRSKIIAPAIHDSYSYETDPVDVIWLRALVKKLPKEMTTLQKEELAALGRLDPDIFLKALPGDYFDLLKKPLSEIPEDEHRNTSEFAGLKADLYYSFAMVKFYETVGLAVFLETCKELLLTPEEERPTATELIAYCESYKKYQDMPVSWGLKLAR